MKPATTYKKPTKEQLEQEENTFQNKLYGLASFQLEHEVGAADLMPENPHCDSIWWGFMAGFNVASRHSPN